MILAAMDLPCHQTWELIMSRFAGLTPLLAPRSIAVLGASSDPTRIGGRPIAYMRAQGFAGALYPVNPNRSEIQGLKAYPSVADLPETPDVAIVAVPAELAAPAIEDLAKRGVKGVIMFTAGFAEMDDEGAVKQAQMVATARPPVCASSAPTAWACSTPADPTTQRSRRRSTADGRCRAASASPASPARMARIFTPSRATAASVRRLCVMTGNEADVTVGECIGWLAENPDVDVIAVYAEGIREAPGLIAALETARAAKKPIVMQKVGRSELGGKAAKSHTASIAGDDAVTEAVMREFGVFRARNSEEMLDIAHTATRKIYPAKNTLGVITVSGGAGVLISDVAESLGLAMPEMPMEAQQKLRALVPFCAPRNPVDATAQVSNDVTLVKTFTESMVRDGGYASVLGFFSMTASARRWPAMREQLNAVKSENPDRLYVLSVIVAPERRDELEADGWVVHEDPTRAVTAIDAMGRFGAAFAAKAVDAAPTVPAVTLPAATPSEAEAKRLLATAGIASAPEAACATADEAAAAAQRFGFPVVMKILSPDIVHKSEIGGVLLDVADAGAVRSGFPLLLERAKNSGAGRPHRGRAGRETTEGRRRVHPGHPPRSGVRPDGDVRPGRNLRRGAEGRRFPPLPVRRRYGGGDDPLDQGRAAVAGCAWAEEGGCDGAGGDAVAAVGVRGGGG